MQDGFGIQSGAGATEVCGEGGPGRDSKARRGYAQAPQASFQKTHICSQHLEFEIVSVSLSLSLSLSSLRVSVLKSYLGIIVDTIDNTGQNINM